MSSEYKEHHVLVRCVVEDFERLATTLGRAVSAFAQDDSGSIDLDALDRARDAARYGAEICRKLLNDTADPI